MIWCLHGAVGMVADWDGFAERMAAAGHEVRAIDLWAFVEEGACAFTEFAAKLAARVREEDAEPVLLGYSLGGRLALHALRRAEARWKAGVIVSAHPGLRAQRDRVLRMARDAEWAAKALVGDWEAFLASWNAQGVLQGGDLAGLADRGALEARREAVARGFMEWSLGKQADLRAGISEIACPLLWLTGEGDERFTALAGEVLPGAGGVRHEVVGGAGHRLPWEQPEAFARLVDGFLTEE